MCEISVDSLHNAWLDSGFIRFIARPFVDLKKFKQSLLQTFSVRLGVGAGVFRSAVCTFQRVFKNAIYFNFICPGVVMVGPGQNLYFQDSTKHPSAAALLATDSFASFRRCTDWHLEFQVVNCPALVVGATCTSSSAHLFSLFLSFGCCWRDS